MTKRNRVKKAWARSNCYSWEAKFYTAGPGREWMTPNQLRRTINKDNKHNRNQIDTSFSMDEIIHMDYLDTEN